MTKNELEGLSREELIEMVLSLQEEVAEFEGCFDDENEEDWEDLDDEDE